MALLWPPAVFRYFGHSNRKSVQMIVLVTTHNGREVQKDNEALAWLVAPDPTGTPRILAYL